MAGHSQFKNIMYRKGAQDAKRAKMFTKLQREITVAARTGLPEPDKNPRLRAAIQAARKASMPKDNIDRAIKKAAGGDADADFAEMRYEGYGPAGVAVIVEALTDNRNRTAAEVRALFNKHGGTLGETGSVGFLFNQLGEIVYPAEAGDADALFEAALDAGADNVESSDEGHVVTTAADDFARVRDALEETLGTADQSGLVWRPLTTTAVDEGQAETLLKLLDALDDNDDVQRVSANFEITDEVMERLTA